MKKRGIFSLILALALLLAVIPYQTVKADTIYAHSYEEWLAMKDEPTQTEWAYDFSVMGTGFKWPEEECEIVIEKQLYVDGSWTIPANVKVVNKSRVSLSGSVNIYGTWENTGEGTLNGSGTVNIEDGGHYVVAEDATLTRFSNILTKSGGTLEVNCHSIVTEPGATMVLESGADLTGKFSSIWLGGTFQADGLVTDASVDARTQWEGEVTDARLEGTMTVGSIAVSDGTLTIPAGSDITAKWGLSMSDVWKQGNPIRVAVGGELTLQTGLDCQPSSWGTDEPDQVPKTLEILDGGVVNLAQGSQVDLENGAPASITGTGRLNVYGRIEGNRYYVPGIHIGDEKYYSFVDSDYNGLQVAIADGYLADTLTIWRSWVCDHDWVKSGTVEPTCTSEGYTTYTCSLCGNTEQRDPTEKTEHTPDGNTDCTKETLCTVCGTVLKKAGAHTWKSESEESFTRLTCTVCGEEQTIEFEKKDGIDLTLSGDIFDALAAQAAEDGYIAYRISAEVVGTAGLTPEQKQSLDSLTDDGLLIEVTLEGVTSDGRETVSLHDLGGEVQITVPYDAGADLDTHVVKVSYLSEDGKTEEMDAVYDVEAEKVTFTTNHFSTYAVYTEEIPQESDDTDGQEQIGVTQDKNNNSDGDKDKDKDASKDDKTSGVPDTGDSDSLFLWIVLLMASCAAAGLLLRGRKKN